MLCPGCGKQVRIDANFCSNCGAQFVPSDTPQSNQAQEQVNQEKKPEVHTQSIWNPAAIVWWSFLFGPIWGTQLAWLNWRRLDYRTVDLRSTRNWQLGAFLLTAATNYAYIKSGGGLIAPILQIIILATYTIIWYFASHRLQVDQVRVTFERTYSRRSWVWPIIIGMCLIALGVLLGYVEVGNQ